MGLLRLKFLTAFKCLLVVLCCGVVTIASAQETVVKGTVTDGENGDPLPFVNVVFPGTSVGITTDFDGHFTLKTSKAVDSVAVSYIGYKRAVKPLKRGQSQTINFRLTPDVQNLEEVVFVARENPAFAILRKVVDNKKYNNRDRLEAYEYESYNKIEVDVDNLSDAMRKRKVTQQIISVIDSTNGLKSEEGVPILPVFISETISNFYYRKDPVLKTENVLKTRIKGVGVQSGDMLSQMIGSTFQDYNFYDNWLTLLGKDFVSPIADGWKLYYQYDLMDSLYIGDHFCYRIDVYPKRKRDLAFVGTIWIDKETYALKQIDVRITENANLNYIEKIKIQQEHGPTEAGPWLPVKTRMLLDLSEPTDQTAGMLAKFYVSNDKIKVNQPRKLAFYNEPVTLEEDAREADEVYWQSKRHEPLAEPDVKAFDMIDTIRTLPAVKTYETLGLLLVSGHKTFGPVEIGPYTRLYAWNNLEGHRFRIGGRTNNELTRNWFFKGHLAYGTRDTKVKYGLEAQYIINRSPWMTVGASYLDDVQLFSLDMSDLMEDKYPIFAMASYLGNLRGPYYAKRAKVSYNMEIAKGLNQLVEFKHERFDPKYPFAYISGSGEDADTLSKFNTTEIVTGLRFGKGERFIIDNHNQRSQMGNVNWPIFTLKYALGLKGVFGSSFNYHKLTLNIEQNINMGFLGRADYILKAGKVFGDVPYPLVKNHLGNASPFFTNGAFNVMNPFEFASDQYVSLQYFHRFEGFLLNRVPLIRRLNWRLIASANMIYGSLSPRNQALSVDLPGGLNPQSLEKLPYVEVGYGIENIFKVLRVDFFHRITYTDRPDIRKFGVKGSFQFIL